MSRVEEIEAVVEALSVGEFRGLVRWVVDIGQRRWDQKMDRDATSGRLESVFG